MTSKNILTKHLRDIADSIHNEPLKWSRILQKHKEYRLGINPSKQNGSFPIIEYDDCGKAMILNDYEQNDLALPISPKDVCFCVNRKHVVDEYLFLVAAALIGAPFAGMTFGLSMVTVPMAIMICNNERCYGFLIDYHPYHPLRGYCIYFEEIKGKLCVCIGNRDKIDIFNLFCLLC